MARIPELTTDGVQYAPKRIYALENMRVDIESDSALDIYGNVYINGSPVSTGAYFDVRNFGAKGDGVTDDTVAIQATIAAALQSNPRAPRSTGTAYSAAVVQFSSGTYLTSTDMLVDIRQYATSTSVGDYARLVLRGTGDGNTLIKVTSTNGWTFWHGQLTVEGIRFHGNDTNKILSLGRITDVNVPDAVSQFIIDGCQFHYAATPITIGYAYDGVVRDCLFNQITGISLSVPLHSTNNSNNINLFRCHFQTQATTNAVFVRIRGAVGPKMHGPFGFYGCHFETSRRDSQIIDAEFVRGLTFTGCDLIQNGSEAIASTLGAIRLVDTNVASFTGCNISRSGTGAYPRKLFLIGGLTQAVGIDSCWLQPATGGAGAGKDDCWEADPVTARTLLGRALVLSNCMVDSGGVEVSDDRMTLTHPTIRSRRWAMAYNTANDALTVGWNNATGDYTSGLVSGLTVYNDGNTQIATGLRGTESSILDDDTTTFSLTSVSDPNRRGVHIVQASTPSGQAWALVCSGGGSLVSMLAGTEATVATANPDIDGKLCIYLSGTSIAVKNRLGSTRTISVFRFGF
jgi:hypothetical protein